MMITVMNGLQKRKRTRFQADVVERLREIIGHKAHRVEFVQSKKSNVYQFIILDYTGYWQLKPQIRNPRVQEILDYVAGLGGLARVRYGPVICWKWTGNRALPDGTLPALIVCVEPGLPDPAPFDEFYVDYGGEG